MAVRKRMRDRHPLTEADIRTAELELERCREKLRESEALGRSSNTLSEWKKRVRETESRVREVAAAVERQKEKDAFEVAEGDRWWEVAKEAVCRYSCLDSCILYGKRKHYSCYVVGAGAEHQEVDLDENPLWRPRSVCASSQNCRMFRPDSRENLERRAAGGRAGSCRIWTCTWPSSSLGTLSRRSFS